MSLNLNYEIDQLKTAFKSLSTQVEDNLKSAFIAYQKQDTDLAKQVIENDNIINQKEIDVEEECLKILALHQPVASDLRYITSILKIISDLERIGDLAGNIAKKVMVISNEAPVTVPFNFEPYMNQSATLLKNSLDALVNLDVTLAKEVCKADEEVDAFKKQANTILIQTIKEQPNNCESLLATLSVSRCIERIADHATNIAEDVIYLAEGEIIRHAKTKKWQ